MEHKWLDLQNPLLSWVTQDLHHVREMDNIPKKNLETPNKRLLSYTKTILKIPDIPEYWKIDDNNLHLLVCVNTYSMVRIYNSFFQNTECSLWQEQPAKQGFVAYKG